MYQLGVSMEGKGFGIVASTFIKRGTVILKEDAQMPVLDVEVRTLISMKRGDDPETISPESEFIKDSEPWMNFIEKVLAFFNKMKKSDQKEYLELFNCLDDIYDPQRENSRFKENLVMWIKKMEEDKKKVDEIFKIVSIYLSNSLRDGLKIKRARFNHSCRPNTFEQHGTNEIRAGSNIKPGQEITVNYAGTKLLFNMLSGEMRHNFLFVNCNVADCFCKFCKKDTFGQGYRESLYNTDHIAYMPTVLGSKMDKLIAELELLSSDCSAAKENPDLFTPEKCRRHVDLCKELYKLGKERKDQTISLYTILNMGYGTAHLGILMVWKGPKKQMAEEFKKDCISFCKAMETFSKLFGKQLITPEEWRERHQNYDKYLDDFGVKLTRSGIKPQDYVRIFHTENKNIIFFPTF